MTTAGQAVMSVQPDATHAGTTASTTKPLPKPRKETDWSKVQPTLNPLGQMYCSHPKRKDECDNLTFPTRSTWVNHHNKHSRPYVCLETSCVGLPGFTYSGGLLRHQREVHKAFGGPKVMLICPYPYCKRNTGKGFTRKENLNEHIRRCHGPSEELAADGAEGEGNVADAQAAIDQALETGQGPLLNTNSEPMDTSTITIHLRKRKRVSPPVSGEDTVTNLQDPVSEQQQESKSPQPEHIVLDPALSEDLHHSNIFTSVPTQSSAMLSMEIENLTEQNTLLQRERAFLSNLVQEKHKQIMELQQQLALFTGTPISPLQTPCFDNPQLQLQQQEQEQPQQQQQHQDYQRYQHDQQQSQQQVGHPRLLTQFGIGVEWAKSVEMQTDGSIGL